MTRRVVEKLCTKKVFVDFLAPSIGTSDFQSDVGEVFGEIGGEPSGEVGRRFSEASFGGKLSQAFSTKTPPQISPSNFTTRFWVVAGPILGLLKDRFCGWFLRIAVLR